MAGFAQELRKRFVPIQTVGFGTPAQVDEDLLRNMSLETSGVSYMAVNATTMESKALPADALMMCALPMTMFSRISI